MRSLLELLLLCVFFIFSGLVFYGFFTEQVEVKTACSVINFNENGSCYARLTNYSLPTGRVVVHSSKLVLLNYTGCNDCFTKEAVLK